MKAVQRWRQVQKCTHHRNKLSNSLTHYKHNDTISQCKLFYVQNITTLWV